MSHPWAQKVAMQNVLAFAVAIAVTALMVPTLMSLVTHEAVGLGDIRHNHAVLTQVSDQGAVILVVAPALL